MRCSLIALLIGLAAAAGHAQEPLLRPNDRVALLGGTFIERMQSCGALEAELQCRRPEWKLSLRNLGWSGDDVHGIARKRFDSAADGFKRLLADVETADPTVVLVAYGFSEASDGPQAVDRFGGGLKNLVGRLVDQNRRVILITPVGFPGYRVPDYQQSMERCRAMVQQVGRETQTAVVAVDWQPSGHELTADKLLPSPAGYAKFADLIAGRLVGGEPCSGSRPAMVEKIVRKNELFFHRYRPQNETYLFLFRKHEQGNNAIEIPQFDPLIKKADETIWSLAAE